MLFETQADLVPLLAVSAVVLLLLAIAAGIIAIMNVLKVREFQDLLHKADRKIDHLERRMFHVLNAVPVALLETDVSGKFTFANKAAHMLLGRKDTELLGLRFHSATWGITYPDGRVIPPDLMPISRTLRGQTVKGFQHLIAHPQTRGKILVSVTSMPITNANGEVIGSTSAMVEIESGTGEGIGDLAGLWRGQWFTSARLPFWGLDSAGTVVDLNAAACDTCEITREDGVGRNFVQTFVVDEDLQAVTDFFAEVLSPQGRDPSLSPNISVRLKGLDGQTFASSLSAWRVRTLDQSEQGITVLALIGTAQNTLSLSALAAAAPQMMMQNHTESQNETPVDASQSGEGQTKPTSGLDEAQLQTLADLKKADQARADYGIGAWYYDQETDTIVEDSAMRALIGRKVEGGQTMIGDEDQLRANIEFDRLLKGDVLEIDLELKVNKPEGPRLIALRGKRMIHESGFDIHGMAIDLTEYRFETTTPAPNGPSIPPSSDQDEAALAKSTNRQALDEAVKVEETQAYQALLATARGLEDEAKQAESKAFALQQTMLRLEQRLDNALKEATDAKEAQAAAEAMLAETKDRQANEPHKEPLTPSQDEAQIDDADATLKAEPKEAEALGTETPKADPKDDHATTPVGLDPKLLQAINTHLENALSERDQWAQKAQGLEDALQALETEIQALKAQSTRQDDALQATNRYETMGRMTSTVANDFHQMLSVINNALDMIQKQSDNPDHIKRLSEAALAAGRRGEKLTKQLQAFSESDTTEV